MKNYKIIQGDCVVVTAELDDESIDLSVFSPPYDNIRDYKKGWVFDYPALGKNFAKSLTTFKLAVDWCENAGWRLFETCIYQRFGNPGAWWNSRFHCCINAN